MHGQPHIRFTLYKVGNYIVNLYHWNEPLLAQPMTVTILLSTEFLSQRSFLEVVSQLVPCHAPSLATAVLLSIQKSVIPTKHWWYSRIQSYWRTHTEGPIQQPHSILGHNSFTPLHPRPKVCYMIDVREEKNSVERRGIITPDAFFLRISYCVCRCVCVCVHTEIYVYIHKMKVYTHTHTL